MKMKICPVCDQPIKGMYCKHCRKIVLNPSEQEVQYYLNSRHPEMEHDCTYHAVEEKQDNLDEVRSSQSLTSPRETRNPFVSIVVAGIVMLTLVLVLFIIVIANAINDVGHLAVDPEPDYSMGLIAPKETKRAEMEEWERTDDEVRELGVSCNGFGHFPVVFEDAVEVLRECIDDAGYNWSMGVSSYNLVFDDTTWYETVYEFTIQNRNEYAGYLNISVDTATGEIHGMEMYTKYEKGFYEVADIAVKFLEQIGAAERMMSGKDFFETAYKAQGSDRGTVQKGLEVICEVPSDESEVFRMEIYALKSA